MNQNKETEITKGWTYQVNIGTATIVKTVKGIFKRYSKIGDETSVVLDTSTGTIFIPVKNVFTMVLLEQKNEPVQPKKKEEPGVYYG